MFQGTQFSVLSLRPEATLCISLPVVHVCHELPKNIAPVVYNTQMRLG